MGYIVIGIIISIIVIFTIFKAITQFCRNTNKGEFEIDMNILKLFKIHMKTKWEKSKEKVHKK